jgi:hypothetical protein
MVWTDNNERQCWTLSPRIGSNRGSRLSEPNGVAIRVLNAVEMCDYDIDYKSDS